MAINFVKRLILPDNLLCQEKQQFVLSQLKNLKTTFNFFWAALT